MKYVQTGEDGVITGYATVSVNDGPEPLPPVGAVEVPESTPISVGEDILDAETRRPRRMTDAEREKHGRPARTYTKAELDAEVNRAVAAERAKHQPQPPAPRPTSARRARDAS
jgi:hypothetical protein